jgi:hypothetical protein
VFLPLLGTNVVQEARQCNVWAMRKAMSVLLTPAAVDVRSLGLSLQLRLQGPLLHPSWSTPVCLHFLSTAKTVPIRAGADEGRAQRVCKVTEYTLLKGKKKDESRHGLEPSFGIMAACLAVVSTINTWVFC